MLFELVSLDLLFKLAFSLSLFHRMCSIFNCFTLVYVGSLCLLFLCSASLLLVIIEEREREEYSLVRLDTQFVIVGLVLKPVKYIVNKRKDARR